ncbi:MAG TPA: hypothetical protein VMT18_11465 [Planctomycetota bacterium]|nr:hypothetical protein [Planctomycetota bacterium]
MNVPVALALALGTLALGDAVLRALAPAARGFERFGLAAAAGLAASLFALYLPLAATGRAHFAPLAALQGLALVAALPRAWKAARATTRGGWLAALLFAVGVCGVLRVAVRAPFSAYDDRAIYGLKGKALWLERHVEGDLFADLEVVHYHRDYVLGLPLLIAHAAWASDPAPADPRGLEPAPSAEAWVDRYDAVATWAPWSVLWPAALAALAVALCVRAHSLGRLRPALLPLALPTALVFPWIPGDSWSLSGADLPLTLLIGAAAWCVVEGCETRERRSFLLAGALAAAAFLLKRDVAIAFAAAVLAGAIARAPRPGRAATLATLALVALAVLAARRAGAPIPDPNFEEDYLRALREGDPARWLARLPLIATTAWEGLVRAHMALYWSAVILVAVPLGLVRGGPQRFLALWILSHLLALVAVFMVTPDMVAWHVGTAFTRLLCHLALPAGMLLVAWAAGLTGRVRTELAGERDGSGTTVPARQ